MSRLVPLAVALLAIAAGCTGGPIPPGATDTTPAETASPSPTDAPSTTEAPTETATPAEQSDALPPGVTADGVDNATVLVDAHTDALLESGFVLRYERSADHDGETVGIEQRLVAAPGLDAVRGNGSYTQAGDRTVQHTWFDESMERQLVRTDADGETRYRIPPVGPADSDARAYRGERLVEANNIAELLDGGEFEVTAASDGESHYRLVGENFATNGSFGEREVELTVNEDGVILRMEASGSLSNGNSFAFDYQVERVGVDSVEAPDWVAEAPEPIDTFPAAGFENCTSPYLTLGNEDPDAVPAGSVVTVTLNETEYEASLDDALETGERVALYLDAGGDLRVADVDAVPANRTAMPNSAQVAVETADGLLLSSGSMGFGCESVIAGGSGNGSADGGSSGSGSNAGGSAGE